jgi:hypothetical protein
MAEHPKIQERLPGFKVSMGYGLHAGWAIEVCNNIDCSLEHVYDSLECSPEHARLGTQTPIYSTAHPTRLAAIPLKAQDPKPETRNPKPKTRNAAQGAIGSMLKIDASYLSPHVNLAARLETGTHQFGVDILFSEQVFFAWCVCLVFWPRVQQTSSCCCRGYSKQQQHLLVTKTTTTTPAPLLDPKQRYSKRAGAVVPWVQQRGTAKGRGGQVEGMH